MVAAGILLSRLIGLVRQPGLRALLRHRPTRPTLSTRRSGSRTCCRTCSARACCPRRSFRSTPDCWREARTPRLVAWPARWRRCSALVVGRARAGRRAAHALAHRGDRAGIHRRQARAHHPAGPDPVPGRGAAGAVGLVPGRAQQPPALLPVATRRRCVWNVAIIAALLGFGRGRASTALAEIARVGIGGGQPAAVRRAAAGRAGLLGGSAPAARPGLGARRGQSCATSGPCSSAAASCSSAPMSTRCSPACCPREPSRGCSYAAGALHAAGQPVRDVGLGGGAAGDGERRGRRGRAGRVLRRAAGAGLRQIAFFVVPSAMAFLALGDVVAARPVPVGRVQRAMTVYVWGILAGSAVGLLASTMGRLYASTYYALHDTRTPLRFAVLRVTLTTGLGYLFALPLPVRSVSTPGGARPGSPRRRASPAGWSSCCSGVRSTAGSGPPGCRRPSGSGSGQPPRWLRARRGRSARSCHTPTPWPWRSPC